MVVYICQHYSFSLSWLLLPALCSQVCVSIHALQIGSSVVFFYILYIYALIYNICFSPSDLLHCVCKVLGSSTSLRLLLIRDFLLINSAEIIYFWDCYFLITKSETTNASRCDAIGSKQRYPRGIFFQKKTSMKIRKLLTLTTRLQEIKEMEEVVKKSQD